MEYQVGQIIYLLDNARNAILPARVFEQVTKKTIEGEEEFFYVEVPGAKELLNLSDFDGMVFDQPEKVKIHLFETLKKNVESIVDKAVGVSVEKWGESTPPAPELVTAGESETLIDLGGGRVGRLKE